MFPFFRKKTASFVRDDRGVIAVEFSFVALPFLAMVVAIIQTFLEQMFVTQLDRGVQRFAAELRRGEIILKDVQTASDLTGAVSKRVCPSTKILIGFDCSKLQVQLFQALNCSTSGAASCWAGQHIDFAKAVRKPPVFTSPANLISGGPALGGPSADFGGAGASQLLTVYYPFPKMSSIWNNQPTAVVKGVEVHGILSVATWINDPSVGVF